MELLTTRETSELEQCESVIEKGLKTFVDVGNALLKIREDRLYRLNYATFEDYCKERWGFTNEYARLNMRAAEVVNRLQETPTIVGVLPQTESVVRPLTQLEPEEQAQVWRQAVETAPNGKVTAAHVQSVVKEYWSPQENVQRNTVNDCSFSDEASDYDWTDSESIKDKSEDIFNEFNASRNNTEIQDFQRKLKLTASNHIISDTPGYDGDEWYTPSEYIECARKVLGTIDLDPATCEDAQEIIQAKSFYTKDDDSLRDEIKWMGNVWLNPPYSSQLIKKFITKVINEYECGNIKQAIVLVNNSSDTTWFHSLLNYPVCLTKGRISFWRPNHDEFGTRQGQAIFYLGDQVSRFANEFSSVGKILIAYDNQQ